MLDFQVDLVAPHLDLVGSVGRWLILGRGDQKGELRRGIFVDPWAAQARGFSGSVSLTECSGRPRHASLRQPEWRKPLRR